MGSVPSTLSIQVVTSFVECSALSYRTKDVISILYNEHKALQRAFLMKVFDQSHAVAWASHLTSVIPYPVGFYSYKWFVLVQETVLPSDGIMAIYQQFRQIWRRHPQSQAATASNHMLPPGYQLPHRSAGLSALELALGGADRFKGTTAPAA